MFSGLWSGSPKIVSCTVRNPVLGCFPRCKTRFARCERLFWDARPKDPKSLLAPSLKHFWAFWLFRHLYQASGVATQKVLSNPHLTPKRFYRTPVQGSSEPHTGFYRTSLRFEPPFSGYHCKTLPTLAQ